MSRVGQASVYVGILAEAGTCAKTQPCLRDGDGADCVGSVLVDAFAVDKCGDAWNFEGRHGVKEGTASLQPRGAADDGRLKHFMCAVELARGFTLLQIADYLCEHFFVALGGECVHLRYVRRGFVRVQCFEVGCGGRGGFCDGLGFEGGCSPFDAASVR